MARGLPYPLPERRAGARYRQLVERVRDADSADDLALSAAVARYYFKLLAYKDEYEVARLYSAPEFRQQLEAQFEGDYKLQFLLAPAWLAKRDTVTGEPRKRELGPWMLNVFGVLAKFRFLRGTPLTRSAMATTAASNAS